MTVWVLHHDTDARTTGVRPRRRGGALRRAFESERWAIAMTGPGTDTSVHLIALDSVCARWTGPRPSTPVRTSIGLTLKREAPDNGWRVVAFAYF